MEGGCGTRKRAEMDSLTKLADQHALMFSVFRSLRTLSHFYGLEILIVVATERRLHEGQTNPIT